MEIQKEDSSEQPSISKEHGPALESRRHFLRQAAFFVTSGVLLSIEGDSRRPAPSPASDQAPDKIQQSIGEVRVIDTPANDQAMFVGVYPGGEVVYSSYKDMHARGILQKYLRKKKEAREPGAKAVEPSRDSGAGSGFAIQLPSGPYVCSNEHVLRKAKDSVQQAGALDWDLDCAAVPLDLCTKKGSYAFATLSDLESSMLDGRSVSFSGPGAHFFEVSGRAVPRDIVEEKIPFGMSFEISEDLPRFPPDDFCIVLKKKDIANAIGAADVNTAALKRMFNGMSGSAVFDAQTGEVVGIFHSHILTNALPDEMILAFTGPDGLRELLKRADMKARP